MMAKRWTRRRMIRSSMQGAIVLAGGVTGMGHGIASASAPDSKYLSVTCFGAAGDGRTDDRDAIQRAICAAVAEGPGSRVVFEPGRIYRLGARDEAYGALLVEGARGVTLCGQGATLLAHPSNRILAMYDCRDMVVRDFVLDFDPLPFTQAEMLEIDSRQGSVRFRVAPGFADPIEAGSDQYRDFKSSDCVFLDGATGRFTHGWLRLSEVRRQKHRIFEARFHGSREHVTRRLSAVRPGDFVGIKMLQPPAQLKRADAGRYIATGVASINIAFSWGVRLERIVSYAAPNMTFNAHGSEDITLDGCAVRRRPGSDRLIAGNSDGCHLKSLTLMPRVVDCEFEALMDDSIHIKISANHVAEVRGRDVRLTHGDIAYNDVVIQPGQELSLFDGDQRRHLSYAVVEDVRRVRYREVWATLDRQVPGLAPGVLAFPRPVRDAEVQRCRFGTQLKTAVLLRPPGSVRDCRFDGVAYGVHAFLNDRIEGPVSFGTCVEHCEFLRPSIAGIALSIPSRQSVPPGSHALVAEDCRFVMAGGQGRVLVARNQTGLTMRRLTVEIQDGRRPEELLLLAGCAEVVREQVSFHEGAGDQPESPPGAERSRNESSCGGGATSDRQ
jgi:hypothetical protein